ncbi:hypothetical protein [Geotalea daltonii]|uniref:hypothetical protein n=1 Tax=Geotalea daltonii TaxID=1203471 RepID=UPI0018A85387|nr:hypothetical protein [Geotalea daltonii]
MTTPPTVTVFIGGSLSSRHAPQAWAAVIIAAAAYRWGWMRLRWSEPISTATVAANQAMMKLTRPRPPSDTSWRRGRLSSWEAGIVPHIPCLATEYPNQSTTVTIAANA